MEMIGRSTTTYFSMSLMNSRPITIDTSPRKIIPAEVYSVVNRQDNQEISFTVRLFNITRIENCQILEIAYKLLMTSFSNIFGVFNSQIAKLFIRLK